MNNLRQRVETELRSDILPFWLKYTIDPEHGGFRGQVSNNLIVNPIAPKGLILNARILWTLSRAFSVYRDDLYLQTARRAYDYLSKYFWDEEFGGVFWMLDYLGRPHDTKKRIYGQAFTVYSLAEFYRATNDKDALEKAIRMYQAIERSSYDDEFGGYFETYERDWTLARDQRLSDVDMDEKKSMNTHLHVMEAYATLLSQWNDPGLRGRLKEIIQIFLKRIIDPQTHHFLMFFDEQWRSRSNKISFGHDIEGSWLLLEAAEILGDASLLQQVRQEGLRMAQAVYDKAIDEDGGLLYEGDPSGIIDSDKHWWPQAEAVVGFLNAYQISGEKHFWTAAQRSWDFIDTHIIDHRYGEWFWKVSREGVPSTDKLKVDAWKCPYHNSRTCFEVMARTDGQGEPVLHIHATPTR